MTAPQQQPTHAVPRRPPLPASTWASVTSLGLGESPGTVPVAPVDGSLALQGSAPAPTAVTGPPQTPELRLLQGGAGDPRDVHAWAARFAQGVVEVLGCDRPLPQLVRWTSRRVYADLERRLRILGQASVSEQRLRTTRPQVRSVHVCHPTPECAEVSVHVRHGKRSRALAARLELREGRWQCTALQLG